MHALPELDHLEKLIAWGGASLQAEVVCEVDVGPGQRRLPVHAVTLGNAAPTQPAVGYFGGVHGLERIGSRVVLAWLHSLVMRLRWDVALQGLLDHVRIVFMPIVNPGGMLRGTRANPAGVDLMRNAPIDAVDPVAPLVGGHRLARSLPWYRGRAGDPMEPESAALCAIVEREMLGRPLAIAINCHSGFGLRDRLWFPFAHRRSPMRHLGALHALHEIFAQSAVHHPYVVEPQSSLYLTHGDLWDYLCLRAQALGPGVFLPLTLEMGSWTWLKKNPRQVFSRGGIFNPQVSHREKRVLRRHLALLDFALRAAAAHRQWLPTGEAAEDHRQRGFQRWYAQP